MSAAGRPGGATPPASARTRVRRLPERGRYDRATIDAVLDAATVGHVAWELDGQPYATPTLVWREGDALYLHGSSASRMVRAIEGRRVCVTVTLVDGIVLARSGFEHSVNYRSVMVLGTAARVTDPALHAALLDRLVDRFVPGRAALLRPMRDNERRATAIVRIDLGEASAKISAHGVTDVPGDESWPVWAGVIPVRTVHGTPEPDEHVPPGLPAPGLRLP